MRFVIQRVKHAAVDISGQTAGEIEEGLLVFVGICQNDTTETADKMMKKLFALRIFEDEQGKTNRDIKAIGGNMLIISQFTLYADCRKGNRPSFIHAGSPIMAKNLYDYILTKTKEVFPNVQHGNFGANMQVSLINDGPFTIVLDSSEICS